MDFKKELVKELGLGAIAEETMLNDYVKACEAIAVRYHESKVKTLGLFRVSGSTSKALDFSDCIEKCCCFPVNGLCSKQLECYGSDKCRLDDVLEYYR